MWAALSFAQTPTGTMQGTVTDQQGAVVAGATVTVTSLSTSIAKTTNTDADGRFLMPFVLPGNYKVTVEAKGFRSAQQENVVLEVAQTRSVNFTLSVGTTAEAIEVQATAPVVDTQTSSMGEVIQTRTINDLPLNGRNPANLALLVPTVTDIGGSTIPHVGGSRNSVSEVQIDGQTNILPENNVGDNYTANNPIVDSVEEFNVQTNSMSAEYGRSGGGAISFITKSGGSQFHGSGFEFARNGIFDALSKGSPAGTSKADLHQYQTGGTIGGPIPLGSKRNTFFFFDYQDQHQTAAATEGDTVPEASWLTGDFSNLLPVVGTQVPIPHAPPPPAAQTQAFVNCNATPAAGCIYDPLTINTTTNVRQAFPGNIIPVGRLSTVAKNMIAFYPARNTGTFNPLSPTTTNFRAAGSTSNNNGQWDARVDHDFGTNWHSFFRLTHLDGHSSPLLDYNNPASQGFDGPQHFGSWSGSFNNTFTINPTLLGELRVGVTRATVKRTGAGGAFDPTSLGFPAYVSQTAGAQGQIFPRLNVQNGFAGLGPSGFNAFSQNPLVGDITGSLVKISGAHSIKIGAEYRKLYENFYQFGLPSGQFTIDSSWTQSIASDNSGSVGSGNPFASLLLGLPSGGSTTHDPSVASSSNYGAAYIQDDWKITKRLTLNLGLRWDVELPRTERFNKLSFWDPTQASPLQGRVTVPAGVNCPGCADLIGRIVFTGTPSDQFGRRQAPTQWKDFAPRFGFAYDAGHKLVFRGAAGIIYGPSALQAGGSSGGTGNAGFANQTNFNSTFDNQKTIVATIDDPYPGGAYNLPQGAAGGGSTFLGQTINDTFFASVRNPYSVQYNFNIQYALPYQITLEVGYLGNHGLFLVDGDPGKPFDQVPTKYLALGSALKADVANPFFGVITTPGSDLAQPTVTAWKLLRPFPQYDNVFAYRKATAESKYNAFTFRLNKHFSHGLSLLASFTGEKELDNSASAVNFLGPTSQTYNNQYDPRGEWAVGTQDVSRVLTIGYTYELPFGHGKAFFNNHGVLDRVVGGWQAAGIIRYTTGTPVVLASVGDPSFLGTLGMRPDWNGKSAKVSHPTIGKWFDGSVFSKPDDFTLSNGPRTIPNVRVPGVSNSDLSFFKNNYFGFEDKYNLQFRVEMFNAFNHPRYGGPDANVNDGSSFGVIQATNIISTQRQIQLAVKFNF
jgi:hypothetical protein